MLNMLTRLILPREIIIKKGSLIRLKFLIGKKIALLIGNESLRKNGHLKKIEKYLLASKIDYSIIDGIKEDPDEKDILNISKKLLQIKPDWIIGIGGGSVMDSAKLAWAVYENPEISLSNFLNPFSIPELRKKAKLCLIPTTSGTGSEVTNSAILSINGKKTPIITPCFIPDIAILDPNLTLNIDNKVLACTGIDAFTHAIESYCSTLSNTLTKTYALEGGRFIFQNLKEAIKNPHNILAKENLLYGAMLSGLAQGLTSVGGIHAISHTVPSHIDLTHGHINAIFLIPILKFNSHETDHVKKFLDKLKINDLDNLNLWVSEIMKECDLNDKWGKFSTDFDIKDMSENILNDSCARTNPRKLTVEAITSILQDTK